MYAVDDLSDAIDVTRNFLTPVRAGFWLKLAVVVFFVSGTFGSGTPISGGNPTAVEEVPLEDYLVEIAVVILVLLAIWLVFAAIGAVMEFVLVESLRSTTVHVRRYARRNLGRGLHLLAFQIALWIAVIAALGIPVAVIWLGVVSVGEVALLGIIGYVLYAIVVLLAFSVVGRFTTEFVVPVMLLEERGVVGAWKRFWPTMRRDWTEYAVYYVLSWVVQLAVGVALSILVFLLALVFLIPFVIFAAVAVQAGAVGVAMTALAGLVVGLAFLFVMALVEVPIVAYLRYYALLVLGDTDERFDLIPDQRAAVRPDGGDGDRGVGGEWNRDTDGWGGDDGPGTGPGSAGRGDDTDDWDGSDARTDDNSEGDGD